MPANVEEYNAALRREVAEVVKKQAEVGIDIVSDGEFGKASWSAYILKRISGFEIRPNQLREVIWLGRDRERFGEAIAQDFPRLVHGVPTEACVGPIAYQDHAGIGRAIDNFQAALKVREGGRSFLTAVAPASTAYDGVNEYYPSEKDYILRSPTRSARNIWPSTKPGLLLQVDDAVLANMYDELVQAEPAALPRVGQSASRSAESRPVGHSRGSHSLSRLLRKLACSARLRRAARRDRGSDRARCAPAPIPSKRPTCGTNTNGGSGKR